MSLRPGLVTEPILLQVPDAAGMLHWAEVFGNGNPVELEIGSGKGTFLLRSAQTWRDRNFIGIEWAKAYAEFAADRLRRHNCLNARMVHADGTMVAAVPCTRQLTRRAARVLSGSVAEVAASQEAAHSAIFSAARAPDAATGRPNQNRHRPCRILSAY